jgi:hypothetical protein
VTAQAYPPSMTNPIPGLLVHTPSCLDCGHRSDCALHNEPAMPNGDCNCDGPGPACGECGGPVVFRLIDTGEGYFCYLCGARFIPKMAA